MSFAFCLTASTRQQELKRQNIWSFIGKPSPRRGTNSMESVCSKKINVFSFPWLGFAWLPWLGLKSDLLYLPWGHVHAPCHGDRPWASLLFCSIAFKGDTVRAVQNQIHFYQLVCLTAACRQVARSINWRQWQPWQPGPHNETTSWPVELLISSKI